MTKEADAGIFSNFSIAILFSFAESAPTRLTTCIAWGCNNSVRTLTWDVKFVRMIGVRPSAITVFTSSIMRLFLTLSVDNASMV